MVRMMELRGTRGAEDKTLLVSAKVWSATTSLVSAAGYSLPGRMLTPNDARAFAFALQERLRDLDESGVRLEYREDIEKVAAFSGNGGFTITALPERDVETQPRSSFRSHENGAAGPRTFEISDSKRPTLRVSERVWNLAVSVATQQGGFPREFQSYLLGPVSPAHAKRFAAALSEGLKGATHHEATVARLQELAGFFKATSPDGLYVRKC